LEFDDEHEPEAAQAARNACLKTGWFCLVHVLIAVQTISGQAKLENQKKFPAAFRETRNPRTAFNSGTAGAFQSAEI
jgi:hypothetical protein